MSAGNPHGIRAFVREGKVYLLMDVRDDQGRFLSCFVGQISDKNPLVIHWALCQEGSRFEDLPHFAIVKEEG